jgi:hypothetical protein
MPSLRIWGRWLDALSFSAQVPEGGKIIAELDLSLNTLGSESVNKE